MAYASRTLTDPEKNYAQIEKECLACTWACEKFDKYLRGMENFQIITDHKPPIPLMNTKSLDEVPLRCQRLLIRLRNYCYVAHHIPGKEMHISDALSRSPLPTTAMESDLQKDIGAYIAAIEQSIPTDHMSEVMMETKKDSELHRVMVYVQNGWPKHASHVGPGLASYYINRAKLSTINHMFPQMFQDCFTINKNCKSKETRQSQLYFIPRARTNYLEKTILVQGPTIANKYKDLYLEPCSIGTFKRHAKALLLSEIP